MPPCRKCRRLPEWQDAAWLKRNGFPLFSAGAEGRPSSVRHRPVSSRTSPRARASPMTNCWRASSRSPWSAPADRKRQTGRVHAGDGHLRKAIIAALPYSLTLSQSRALDAIVADLGKAERMVRLLQGDVGSGKTVVALLAAAAVIETGRAGRPDGADRNSGAAAFQDHRAAGGSRRHPRRNPHRPRTRQGSRRARSRGWRRATSISCVGTHALFQDEVVFRDLALAVIDEQHRFGVHQRARAGEQGRSRRHAGDDRDADPAHAGADLFRRHGYFRIARKAGRPPADRHPHHSARPPDRSRRGGRPRAR